MPIFTSYDGAELAYREVGHGPALLVLPGGPARDAAYLGDLAPLATATGRTLVVPDLRGTGDSRPDTAPPTHRADRLAADVAALLEQRGAAPVDVLAHSAGASVALLLAEARPGLVSRLVLLTPGTRSVGLGQDDDAWEAAVGRRAGEPWYAEARAGLESDEPTPAQDAAAGAFFYGRWDDEARAHAASDALQRNVAATGWFHAGAYEPDRTRAAMRDLAVPVRILVGEVDLWPDVQGAGALASLFPDAAVTVLPGVGHFPWVDDPAAYVDAVRVALTD